MSSFIAAYRDIMFLNFQFKNKLGDEEDEAAEDYLKIEFEVMNGKGKYLSIDYGDVKDDHVKTMIANSDQTI
jgi:hypothetical protein